MQVLLREADRDTFRFHRIGAKDYSQVETLRFKWALFGLVQSAFLLARTLKQHLQTLRTEYPKYVEEIMRSHYVDVIVTGEDTVHQVHQLKRTAIEVFKGHISNSISGTLMYQDWKHTFS